VRESHVFERGTRLIANPSNTFHESDSDQTLHAGAIGYDSTRAHTGTVHVCNDRDQQYRYLQKRACNLGANLHRMLKRSTHF